MHAIRTRTRAKFAALLEGDGLEIGALNDPLPIPRATGVLYSDWLPPEQLLPGSRVPDILSDSESFPSVADHTFDFVVANHVLEHLTDPIGALIEWHRILRIGGLLMLTLPDKRFTFDAHRRRTPLSHLVADHQSREPPELRNRDHLEDWATHVESLPHGSSERATWIEAQLRSGYSVHNHVWIPTDIVELVEWLNRTSTTRWNLLRFANTSPLTNEFILMLEAHAKTPRRLGRLRTRLALSDLPLSALAAGKRLLRGSDRRRFSPL